MRSRLVVVAVVAAALTQSERTVRGLPVALEGQGLVRALRALLFSAVAVVAALALRLALEALVEVEQEGAGLLLPAARESTEPVEAAALLASRVLV
jgi:hypothetical protein